ncbi:carboxylating nicotinate-nucleotide diphosphorylase [Halobacillus mangrovi]|uniref:Probable nicotinate-nucleotide pyrophosphorylase [carboxylating] n=1 Tax=Halobacillus mangrovi TaxID=402384 RepID=A0A1W6A0C7_9BACI|nr:carboxylating nicotinate-nucleotide diphosphorylase [Halobacillus mangrovi]ARI78969.1 nicotinate-nucleotide diphosphorylase (carboxylating) [Halobacillus mangrovi]
MNKLKLKRKLEEFFIEDIGDHDVTSDYLFPDDTAGEMVIISKQDGIFCGSQVIDEGFRMIDNSIETQVHISDGAAIASSVPIATISGPMASLLKGERVILNLIQRMSGIATKTSEAVQLLNSEHTRICDTRKTTPGLRMFEKYAVRAGGGANHRYGLYDAVMIKDNHIAFAGSILEAVKKVRAELGHMVKIEVETENENQVLEAVKAGADCIMFDNCSHEYIEHFLTLVPETITTEISGGITLENVASYGNLSVDYISLGALTHSVQALDISAKVSMKIKEEQR